MAKTCKDLLKDAILLHVKELKDSMVQVETWRGRFKTLQRQKQRYQEECKLSREKNQNLAEINANLREQIDVLKADRIRKSDSKDCTMCRRLEKIVDNLSEVYNNSLTEKDKRIAYLESRLASIQGTDSSLNQSYLRTPHKQEEVNPNVSSHSRGKPSPDSTCKVTPNKNESPDNSRNVTAYELEKGSKLRLTKKPVKRSRYQEDPSPENKRQKVSGSEVNTKNGNDSSSRKSAVLIPETCDFDSDLHTYANEDEPCDSEHEYSSGKMLNKNTKHAVNSKQVVNDSERNAEMSDIPGDREMKVIPETVAMEIISSESDYENDVNRTVKDRTWDEKQYSLRSILCSPSSENSANEETYSASRRSNGHQGQQKSTASGSGKVKSQDRIVGNKCKEDSKTSSPGKIDIDDCDSTRLGRKKINLFSSDSRKTNKEGNIQSPCGTHVGEPASDVESPLLLKVGQTASKDKAESVSRLFDVDLDSDSSDKSDGGQCSPKVQRRTRNSQSKITRSQGRSPDDLSMKQLDSETKSSQTRKKRNVARNNSINRLKQMTLSQVFVNSPETESRGAVTRYADQEEKDLQKAIELSLVDEEDGKQHEITSKCEKRRGKENTPPFKKPNIPRKVDITTENNKSVNVKGRLCSDKKVKVQVHDPDETLPPNSSDVAESPEQGRKKGQRSFINSSLNMQGQLNGSLDPDIQLSQLCENSQKSREIVDTKHNSSQQSIMGKTKKSSSQDESSLNRQEEIESPSKALNEYCFVGTLTDFTHDDLKNAPDMPRTSTCVDMDEYSQTIPCSSVSVKFGPAKKRVIRVMEDFSEDEEDVGDDNTKRSNKVHCDLDDSFDRVPKSKEEEYAYVDVVRKQDERRKLQAYECRECNEYYGAMGLSEEEIKKRVQTCSKHRARYVPPGTPEHFWDIGIEDTLVCEDRGYIQKEERSPDRPRYRRKRQLKKIFKSKKEEND